MLTQTGRRNTRRPHEEPSGRLAEITPAVFYDDAGAAIDWLASAFGFEVQERIENERGQVVHSQLALSGGLIMVGQAGLTPGRTYPRSPRSVDGANTQSLMMYVDDADAHCERARSAAATIATEPATQDYGGDYWSGRSYEARDVEGHYWWFVQRLRGSPLLVSLYPRAQGHGCEQDLPILDRPESTTGEDDLASTRSFP